MSVVGIDFGNDTCYISVARQGGIETIANDYSLRGTPSYVAFGERQRTIGVAAKSGQMTNVKRTFFGFKRLLGRQFDDPQVKEELSRLPFEVIKQSDGSVGCPTQVTGQPKVLSAEQLTAALFTKLKTIGETALQQKVVDVVVSVPAYFTDSERRALLDSARMAGLNVLKLMNDTTATALAYGIYKQDLPESDKPPRNVVFVDIGYSGTQVAASSFHKGKLTLLSSSYCQLGGRFLDETIAKFMMKDFAERYKLDVASNKKATLKLLLEAEKLKKLMSASTHSIPVNIECFMNDIDVKSAMDRATFEELIGPHLLTLEQSLKECLEASKLSKEDIYSVEIVGGSSRVPAIKTVIEKVFEKVPSTTLNADEAVSRGCALQCAILSPTFKVREFSVTDIQPYAVKLTWETSKKDDVGEMEVFPRFHAVPFSKMLTFYKSEPFSLTGMYVGEVPLPRQEIGQFEVGEVKPNAEGGNQKVKVKVRLNPNGIFSVSSASLIEKVEVEEEVEVEMEVDPPAAAAAEGSTPAEGAESTGEKAPSATENGGEAKQEEKMAVDAQKEEKKEKPKRKELRKKIVNKTIDLAVTGRAHGSLSQDKLQAAMAEEVAMTNQDIAESERLVAKNSVEEYIYDIRGKVCGDLEEYMEEEARNAFTLELEDAENWLYEEGEDADEQAYQSKLKVLKEKGEPVKRRKHEADERPAAMNAFGQCLQLAQKAVDSFKAGDEKFNHLDSAEVSKVEKAIAEKTQWYQRIAGELNSLAKTADAPVLASQLYQEKDAFWNMASNILNKPKPKVEPPPQAEQKPADNKEAEAGKKPASNNPENKDNSATVNGDSAAPHTDMDVD